MTPIQHCVAKVVELATSGADDRRAWLQLGYNLGRLSELTGLGREPFWDRWKEAVALGDRSALGSLAVQLQAESATWPETRGGPSA
jgi:hypothetical protein